MPNRNVEYQIRRFMTVTADLLPEGLNMSCWMSTVEFWSQEKMQYPHEYTYSIGDCNWLIHCNTELTIKAVAMVAEYAQKICDEQQAKNEKRKLANR